MLRKVNPLTHMDYPDPDVIRVGDTFYMVSTTMYFMPGGALLKSYDLVHWELVTYLFDKLDDTPEERMEQERTEYAGGMWAPCIRYHEGKFYVVFVSHKTKTTYLFVSEKPEGPWEKRVIEGYYHDVSMLFDEDGRVYLTFGNSEIHLLELREDLTGPKEGGIDRIIIKEKDDVILGYEGSHIYKINGYYYVFLIHWPRGGMRTESCFRAESLTGEFVGGDVLQDDNGYCGQGVAQGGIVDTVNGKWFGVLFQDSGAVGRIPVLVPVTWKDDFPVFGEDGKIPEKLEVVSSRPGYQYAPLYTSDSFKLKEGVPKEKQLALPWQWNHQPDNNLWELLPEGGLCVKTGKISANLTHARNCLTQRMYLPRCEAEVTVDASEMRDGDVAGLCVLQSCYGLIGITKELGNYYLVKIVRRGDALQGGFAAADYMPGELENKIRLAGPEVTLCLRANFEDMKDRLDFYYYKEPRFVRVGSHHHMEFRLEHFTGCRFGLVYYSTRKTGGTCVFKNFRYDAD